MTQPFFAFLLTACSHFDGDCCFVCSEDSWMLLVPCDEIINACLSRIVCCPTNRNQCELCHSTCCYPIPHSQMIIR